jgi:hypothetical protein
LHHASVEEQTLRLAEDISVVKKKAS